jgi:hypothetical protein
LNIRLADKPSGCVVWVVFDEASLELGPFLWFGGPPDQPLPDIRYLPVAKHSKGNARGQKTERPNIRVLKRGAFELVASLPELVSRMFGQLVASPIRPLKVTDAAAICPTVPAH